MNSFERYKGAVRHDEPDCVPVAPYIGLFGGVAGGARLDRYCQSGKLMAEAQLRTLELCDTDVVVAQSDNYYIAEGFGIEVEHHEDSIPTETGPAVNSLEEVYDLQVPNPQTDGRMSVFLEAIEILSKQLKNERIIRSPGTGPFSLAGHLMGLDKFLMEIAMVAVEPDEKKEKALRHLMELTTDALIEFHKACIDAGADTVHAGDSLASLDMISPQIYTKWVFPFEKRYFSEINAYGRSKETATILHICGDTTKILSQMAETGADILEIDSKVDLKIAKEMVGSKVCLMGNIEPSAVLLQGTVMEVEHACRKAIEDAGKGGGFILGSGCEVPPRTAVENIQAMVRVGRSYTYPL